MNDSGGRVGLSGGSMAPDPDEDDPVRGLGSGPSQQQPLSSSSSQRYSELRIAPATTTSVVTTTTTTTVHFAPILVPRASPASLLEEHGPSHLHAKRFPLAEARFPAQSDSDGFRIDLGKRVAKFLPDATTSESRRPHQTVTTTTTAPAARGRAPSSAVITPPELVRDRSPPRKRARASTTSPEIETPLPPSSAHHGLLSPQLEPADSAPSTTAAELLELGSTGTALSALFSLPSLLESFDQLPVDVQSYILFSFLQRSPVPVLQTVHGLVSRALKRDFLTDLPPELAIHILGFCDVASLCRASRVSKGWRRLVDGEWRIWKERMARDNFWVGDGSEAEEARALLQGEPTGRKAEEKRFLDNWQRGVWEDEPIASSEKLPVTTAAIELLSPKLSKTRTTRGRSFASTSHVDGNRLASPSSSREPSPAPDNAPKHFVHPYKLLYRRRFIKRRNWSKSEPKRLSFPCQANNVVTCLQFDEDKIISASDDHSIHVFDTKSGALRSTLDGHEGGVWALQYVGNVLVSGSTDRTVRVWDIASGKCSHVFLGHTSTVRCLQIVEPVNVNPDPTGVPIWEPSQPLIVTGSRDWTLRVWKLPLPGRDADYHPAVPMSPTEESADPAGNPFHVRLLEGHRHAVRALAAHGRTLVSGSYDNTVRVWDLVTGRCMHRLAGHTQKVYSIVYDHRRSHCASGSMDGNVRLWSTETGQCLATLDGHSSLVGLLGLSSRLLVSAAADSTLRLWDPATGSFRHALVAHSGAITCFQHDDEKVISGSDGTLKMWDATDGSFKRDLLTGLTGVWQVAFNDRFCVAAVQREGQSYFDVMDFGPLDDEPPARRSHTPDEGPLFSAATTMPGSTRAQHSDAETTVTTINPFLEAGGLTRPPAADRIPAIRRIPSSRSLPRNPRAQVEAANESPTARRPSRSTLVSTLTTTEANEQHLNDE